MSQDYFDHKSRKDRMPKDPIFEFNKVDALIIGAFILFYAGILIDIVRSS